MQSTKDGGNRQQLEWRILIFSTGEYDLKNYVERGGMKWEAGQSVRLPSIPAATLHGVYENLHGAKNGAALSDCLLEAIAKQHGAAGRAWIEKLQTLNRERIITLPEFLLYLIMKLGYG